MDHGNQCYKSDRSKWCSKCQLLPVFKIDRELAQDVDGQPIYKNSLLEGHDYDSFEKHYFVLEKRFNKYSLRCRDCGLVPMFHDLRYQSIRFNDLRVSKGVVTEYEH